MKIGIDIDNTITNTVVTVKEYVKKYHKDILKKELEIYDNEVSTRKLSNWSNDEYLDFKTHYLEEALINVKVKDNASNIIKKIKSDGHEIHLITARDSSVFKTPYETTEKFLKDNDIVYDKLNVGNMTKKDYCIKNNIDIMIEDDPRHIESFIDSIPVIIYDEPYNKQCVAKNFYKASDWNQIYEIINKLSNK